MDPVVLASLISLGSTGLSAGSNFLINSMFGNKDLEASKELATHNYNLQRQFVRDYHSLNTDSLRDAGLNPLLSATSGSSSTFSPSGVFGRSNVPSLKLPGASDFLSLLKGGKELDILDATKDRINAETADIKESTRGKKVVNDHRINYPSSGDHPYNRLMNNLDSLGLGQFFVDLFSGDGTSSAPAGKKVYYKDSNGNWKLVAPNGQKKLIDFVPKAMRDHYYNNQ